jgi:tetratricopeptide (TPR) repeat protein
MKTAAASALGEAFARYHAGDFARARDLALAFATTTAAAEDHGPRVQALLLAATCQDELAEYRAAAATNACAMELAELPPDDAPSRALRIRAQISLGTSHRVLGEYAAAECRLREALSGARAQPADWELLVDALNALAVLFKYCGRFDEAEPLLREAIHVTEHTAGAESADMATLLHNLGGLAHARGDYAAAEAPARRAVDIRQALLGINHPTVAADRAALAAILDALGQHEDAEALLEDALRTFERTYGPDHYEVAITANNLAAIAQRSGDLDNARTLYERALTVKRRILGDKHPDVAITLNNLAAVQLDLGHPEEATPMLLFAVEVFEANLAPAHPALAAALDNLAEARAREA